MHTYVNAYYLKDGPEKTFFEYLQAELESETERLSHELEHGFKEKKTLITLAQVIFFRFFFFNLIDSFFFFLNQMKVAKKRLDRLLEGVKNGLTEMPISSSHKKK